jgi:[ribosomal protein S5]-alanine N-acetyltransferase
MPEPQTDVPPIRTRRFELCSMSLPFMRALAAGDLDAASRLIGASLPHGMHEDLANFLRYRIPTLEADPASQPWLGRAIVAAGPDGRRAVIGTIGFHASPDETGRVEIGYRVEAAFRRQGVATECVTALLAWAGSQGVCRFRASVAPDNAGSLAIIRRLGFHEVGVQIDEIDGEELVFHLDREPVEAAGGPA